MPVYTWRRWRHLPSSEAVPLVKRGVVGAFVAYFSFGAILLATRIGHVGEAAVLRETSVVFSALIAWTVLGDKVGPRRLTLMVLIAAGAVIVKLAG
ncbi:MAG: EamA family transporter, partial [Rhodobacteraceae bacterium]|nr:EamA family transporter [Paracoccaceae bacterium]